MTTSEFVDQAKKMGLCSKRAARRYAEATLRDSFDKEDFVKVFRYANPDYIGYVPSPSEAEDYYRGEMIVRRVIDDVVCVESIFDEKWYHSDREPVYIRDEHMRLVLNPKRLKLA